MSTIIVNTAKGHTANAKLTVDDTLEVTEIANLNAGVAVLGGGTLAGGLTVSSGGIDVTGAAVLNNGVNGGLTVNDGGASITGNSSITGTLGVSSDLAINTNKFNVAGATGNTTVAGTLDSAGDFSVATNKFTVSATTGDTYVGGALSANGIINAVNGMLVSPDETVALSASGAGATSLLTATNSNGLIASLQTSGNSIIQKLGLSSGSSHFFQTSTSQNVVQIKEDTTVVFNQYGAGTATFDASGNISSSSDSRLKIKTRSFDYGGDAINQIADTAMGFGRWNELSGMETEGEYPFLYADVVAGIIPEAAPKNIKYVREEVILEDAVEAKEAVLDEDGNIIEEAIEAKEAVKEWRDTEEIESDFHTLQDRAIIMALINAHKDQSEQIKALEARIETLEGGA